MIQSFEKQKQEDFLKEQGKKNKKVNNEIRPPSPEPEE
jgi:hypothetical protein